MNKTRHIRKPIFREKFYRINSNSLSPPRDVLREWIKVIERCCEEWEYEEVPWWENEQATVSTLAAAVWKAGSIALEEFSTYRVISLKGILKGVEITEKDIQRAKKSLFKEIKP